MSRRIDEVEAEIEILKARRAALEEYAHEVPYDEEDALWQRHDDLSDQIGRLRRDLDEEQGMAAMRETARDQAYARWAT